MASTALRSCVAPDPATDQEIRINIRSLSHLLHRWVLRSKFVEAVLPEYDLRLRVTPADVVGRHLYKYRRYEPEIAAALATHVKFQPGDICLDVGANVGWYSLLVSRLSQDSCRVYAFEPDPDNFALLQHNLAINGAERVSAVNKAAGAQAGCLALHKYGAGNTGRHSLLAIHEGQTVSVQVIALDEFWQEQALGDTPVRLLKMDIEGYELFALRGASQILQRCEWVLIEHSPDYMRLAGLDPEDLVNLLVQAGFTPMSPEPDGLLLIAPETLAADPDQRNVLWRRSS